jgi:hypothetical protein
MQIYCYKFEGNETYIGMTTRDINIRFDEHCADMSNGTHHSHKVQQTYYLYNKFPNLTVLDSANSLDELKSKEVYWIAKFNTFDKGLNCTRGGDTIYEGKLLQDDYLAIVTFLAYTNFTSKEIANELNVPYSIVNNISS